MPTYTYNCNACNTTKDVIISIHDIAPPQECDDCGGIMDKVWTVPGVKFNASGFYSTGG